MKPLTTYTVYKHQIKPLTSYIKECLNINEAVLQPKDFDKHNYKYIKGLLIKLISGEDVRLGKNGNKGHINFCDLTDSEQTSAQNLLDKLKDGNGATVEEFNDIFKSHKLKLTNFFKGDYSGYSDGLESNKGNAFEIYFKNNYKEKFESDIKKLVNYKTLNSINHDGTQNNHRPLTFKDGYITCGKITNDNFDIGKIVTDITLNVDNEKKIYLSLKSGKSVTFVNSGIKKYLTKSFFDGEKPSDNAKLLLNMFCLDEQKVRDVFNSYEEKSARVQKAEKEKVDITEKLKNNEKFKHFMKSVMGYGYIMVHQIKNDDVEYIDMQKKDDLDKFINDINYAYIEYPKHGQAKRIDIFVDYDKITFKLNIRAKDGGIYPSHLLADYQFKH